MKFFTNLETFNKMKKWQLFRLAGVYFIPWLCVPYYQPLPSDFCHFTTLSPSLQLTPMLPP